MKYFNLLIALLFGNAALAGTWTDTGFLDGVKVDLRDNSPRVIVRHIANDGKFIAQENCRNDKNFYQLKGGSEYTKEAYSMILAAWSSKSKIRFYIEGCGSDWPLIVLADTVLED